MSLRKAALDRSLRAYGLLHRCLHRALHSPFRHVPAISVAFEAYAVTGLRTQTDRFNAPAIDTQSR